VPKDFLDRLEEMHTGEKELVLAIPLLIKAAKSKDLKELLRVHLKETKGHVKALDDIADSLGRKLPHKSCKPITRLIKKGVKVIAKRLVSSDQDSALIAVGQEIEQFEIGAYTPLCFRAKEMKWTHEFARLTSILGQEKLANELLGALKNGKRPLGKVIQKASLKRVTAGRA
jgi:ferritin-like metal-binding protein YciE